MQTIFSRGKNPFLGGPFRGGENGVATKSEAVNVVECREHCHQGTKGGVLGASCGRGGRGGRGSLGGKEKKTGPPRVIAQAGELPVLHLFANLEARIGKGGGKGKAADQLKKRKNLIGR